MDYVCPVQTYMWEVNIDLVYVVSKLVIHFLVYVFLATVCIDFVFLCVKYYKNLYVVHLLRQCLEFEF